MIPSTSHSTCARHHPESSRFICELLCWISISILGGLLLVEDIGKDLVKVSTRSIADQLLNLL